MSIPIFCCKKSDEIGQYPRKYPYVETMLTCVASVTSYVHGEQSVLDGRVGDGAGIYVD
jgi:hypothetical protein